VQPIKLGVDAGIRPAQVAWKGFSYTRIVGCCSPFFLCFSLFFLIKKGECNKSFPERLPGNYSLVIWSENNNSPE